MHDPDKLRQLALWYRQFAERAGNPVIWEARLQTAEDLEAEAERLERRDRGLIQVKGTSRQLSDAPRHLGGPR